jgi:hypothetical protein
MDKRLAMLDALIQYADLSGDDKPEFYKDDMMKKLDVCEHVFNVMQKQVGNRCCRMVDNFEQRARYAINVSRCLELRGQITQTKAKKRRRLEVTRNVLFALFAGVCVYDIFFFFG